MSINRRLVEASSDWLEKWSVKASKITQGIRAMSRNQAARRLAMFDRLLRIEAIFMGAIPIIPRKE